MTTCPRSPAHVGRFAVTERRMHAKGSAALGTFTVTNDVTRYTKARIFSTVGTSTPLLTRFSTVAGGDTDAKRDIRGFAVKFYTPEGNWDLVGNNTPVFLGRDPTKFAALHQALQRDPKTTLRSLNTNWDLLTSMPEALHHITITMSDRGLPSSYRHMHGFGSHTFSLLNARHERSWVKFHLVCHQGIKNLTDAEAEAIVGRDRESHHRDLFNSIERGDFPRWTLFIQVMSEHEADTVAFNPFDVTRTWSHKDYPLIEVGVVELNRNPEDYFAEVEQVAFNPAAVVPGIGFSPDQMLQARLLLYGDAQHDRLGANHHQLPVNAARSPRQNSQRDGIMRVDDVGSVVVDEAHRLGEWRVQPGFREAALPSTSHEDHWPPYDDADFFSQPGALFRLMSRGQQQALFDNTARSMDDVDTAIKRRHVGHCLQADPDADRWNHRDSTDDFSQPGALFRLMSRAQQQVLFDNTARAMDDVDTAIKLRHVGHCLLADPAYGAGVAKALGLSPIGMVPGR